jgi:hypothetical protein
MKTVAKVPFYELTVFSVLHNSYVKTDISRVTCMPDGLNE